jgi:drug/metabolite transporter (DMT)-like permease
MSAPPLSQARPAGRLAAALPYLMLALCALFWAGNWVTGRAIRDTMPPVSINFWRWAIGTLTLAPFALPRLKGKWTILLRHWRLLVTLGFFGLALFQTVVYLGLRYTDAVNAVLMNSATPLVIIPLAWLLDGERVTPRQLVGVAISMIGIVTIMYRGDPMALLGLRFNPGDLLILAAMPAWGLYSVLLRRRPPEIDTISFLFAICFVGWAILVPFTIAENLFFQAQHLTWASAGTALYMGVFAAAGAFVLWNRGVEMVGPSKAGFTIHLVPAFATILAVIFLGESLHPYHAVGVALIMLGVWLATSAKTARAVPQRAAEGGASSGGP